MMHDSVAEKNKKDAARGPFADVAPTPAAHFELYLLAAAARLARRLEAVFGTRAAAFEEFPFLRAYDEKLAGREPDELADEDAAGWWENALLGWEDAAAGVDLPLRALRERGGLDFAAVVTLVTLGLAEEDARFGAIFSFFNEPADARRLTFGALDAWRREERAGRAAWRLGALNELGLIEFGGREAPRAEWTVQPATLLWDVLRGENPFGLGDWVAHTPKEALTPLDELVLDAELAGRVRLLPALVETGDVTAVVVRGPHRNGKRALLGALARALGRGLLEAKNAEAARGERWKTFGTLAVLLGAMPVVALDAAPGETVDFPALPPAVAVCGLTLGKQGGVGGEVAEKAVTIEIGLPDQGARRRLWRKFAGDDCPAGDLESIAERFRLSSGNVRRAAALAASCAPLTGESKITIAAVRQAARQLNRQALDTLAAPLEPLAAGWSRLVVREDVLGDLVELETRCRLREKIGARVGEALREQLRAGVRALFAGASGTGKTYAARLLAGVLQKDLYRLDLSTVVNKYIGETEKNLARVFALVEELDVILLLDEGDALLTQRTSVATANDRYANLETNYLLQRLESFEGILLVTTNASDRIDAAFERRMDCVVEFVPPQAAERRRIWRLHLAADHRVAASFFEEVVARCELTGGQIRNVALHAAALALSENAAVERRHLEAAVRREYRKRRAVCPLREAREESAGFDRW